MDPRSISSVRDAIAQLQSLVSEHAEAPAHCNLSCALCCNLDEALSATGASDSIGNDVLQSRECDHHETKSHGYNLRSHKKTEIDREPRSAPEPSPAESRGTLAGLAETSSPVAESGSQRPESADLPSPHQNMESNATEVPLTPDHVSQGHTSVVPGTGQAQAAGQNPTYSQAHANHGDDDDRSDEQNYTHEEDHVHGWSQHNDENATNRQGPVNDHDEDNGRDSGGSNEHRQMPQPPIHFSVTNFFF